MASYRDRQRRQERAARVVSYERVGIVTHRYDPFFRHLTPVQVSRRIEGARVRTRDVRRMERSGPMQFQSVIVRPRVVPIVRTNSGYKALVRQASKHAPQQRTLCKCHHDRSEEQRRVSRKFFRGYGGRGTVDPNKRACTCH